VTGSYLSGWAPQLSAADDGSVALAWTATDQNRDQVILTATRAVDDTWSPVEALTATQSPVGDARAADRA
jgi:hypothetical protein